MSSTAFDSLSGQQVLHLTTIGRVAGRPREIEIWVIVCREKFSLFSEHPEAAGWVKDIKTSDAWRLFWAVTRLFQRVATRRVRLRSRGREMNAVARVLDYRKDRPLWDEVQAITERKYGWGDGLPVEITPAAG